MIKIERIDHLAQAVRQIEPRLDLFESLFGFRRLQERDDPETGVRRVMLEVPGRTGIGWELMTPRTRDSELHQFLESPRGPGIHHVAIDVPDAARAAKAAAVQEGVEPEADVEGDRVVIGADHGGRGLRFELRGPGARESVTPSGAIGTGANAAPTLGIVAVDHVSHACPDRDEFRDWYADLFGMQETHRTPDGEHDDLADLVMDVAGGQMRWEVLQPVGDDSFIDRFLETRGPAVHHVAFEVEDWDRAMAACEHHGVPTFDDNHGETDGAAWHDAFIHPKYTGGVLVQLFWEARPGAWVASDKVAVAG